MQQVANRKIEHYINGDRLQSKEYLRDIETRAIYLNVSIVKKSLDFFFSLFLLVFVFSWLFPLIALIIKIDSNGPVFFIQNRIGLNGEIFRCFKFRTMVLDNGRYMYTPVSKGDTRITRVGAFLRKTNLDELPQFINVLLGDMSIVGPRPHAVAFHQTYSSFIEYIDTRHLVKPGITGLAQVKGYRGDVPNFEENKTRTVTRIKYDIYYIKMWSLKLDMFIVYKTILQMLGRKTNAC